MADNRYDESFFEKVGLEASIGRLLLQASTARASHDYGAYFDLVDTIISTLIPPRERKRSEKAISEAMAALQKELREKRPKNNADLIERYFWEYGNRDAIVKKHTDAIHKVMMKTLDRHGLLFRRKIVSRGAMMDEGNG